MQLALARSAALLAVAALVAGSPPARAGKRPPKGAGEGTFVRVEVSDPGYEGMYYTVFVPKRVEPGLRYPLMLALHGNGSKAEGHARNLAGVSTAAQPVFVVAPQYQKGHAFDDPRYDGWDVKFHQILDAVIAKHPIDPGRIFLQGFSMGALYACMWTHGSHAGDPRKYRFRAVWLNGTALPPRKPAPRVPYLLMVGERETAVIGNLNITRQTRRCYRSMFGQGLDVRYLEIPGMGHAVNEACLSLMRASVAACPAFGDCVPADLDVPEALEPAVADCRRGRFWKAFDHLRDVRSLGSGATDAERAAAGRIVAAAEAWLKEYAEQAVREIETTRSPYRVDALIELSDLLAANDTAGPALKKARAHLAKSKKLAPELEARERFERAQRTFAKDREAARAEFEKLTKGSLRRTVFARRAAEHLQAMSDAYWGPPPR